MPEDFTVAKVKYAGEKDNPHGGKLYKFYVRLRQETGETKGAPFTDDVYWQRKSRELEEGERVYGHIEQGEFGPRFKTDQRPDGGGNFQRPAYKVEPGAPDPQAERSRRIERQHSQEMAIRWSALVGNDTLDQLRLLTDWFAQDLDADVGSSQVAHGASDKHPPVDRDAADLSAEADIGGGSTEGQPSAADVSVEPLPPNRRPLEATVEASPQQKGKLTQMFNKAGLSRDAMKAVVMFRCGQEKATKQGASQLITDLQEGATHDALLAEIWDAKRAGNPLGARAAALVPTEVPWEDDGSLPEAPKKDESDVPF